MYVTRRHLQNAGDAAAIGLTPEYATGPVGMNHTLTATVTDALGNRVSGVRITWTLKDGTFVGAPEAVTGYNGEARATIISNVAGTSTIKAALSGSLYDEATKDWTASEAFAIALRPAKSTRGLNDAQELIATVTDRFGNPVAGAALEWEN
jgi:hypothetical protein